MADVLKLPTAAAAPVLNHRRRGSYGRKVTSLNSRKAHLIRLERASQRAELEVFLEELRQVAADRHLHGIAFVVDVGAGLYKAGVVGTLKENFQPAEETWVKLAHYMAAHKED